MKTPGNAAAAWVFSLRSIMGTVRETSYPRRFAPLFLGVRSRLYVVKTDDLHLRFPLPLKELAGKLDLNPWRALGAVI